MSTGGEIMGWSSDEDQASSAGAASTAATACATNAGSASKRRRTINAAASTTSLSAAAGVNTGSKTPQAQLTQHTARQRTTNAGGITIVHNAGGVEGLHIAFDVFTEEVEKRK